MSKLLPALLLGLSLLARPVAAGGPDWANAPFTASPSALLEAARPLPPGPDEPAEPPPVEILFEGVRFSVDEQHVLTTVYHRVFVVRSPDTVEQWGSVEVGWSPWLEDRPQMEVRVVRPDGREHRLDPSEISESAPPPSDPLLYSADRELRAPLPGVEPGAVVEQKITIHQHRPLTPSGTSGRYGLGSPVPTRFSQIEVDVPARLPFSWQVTGEAAYEQQSRKSAGRRQLVLTMEPQKDETLFEAWVPADVPRFPLFQFTTARSWNDLARDYHAMVSERATPKGIETLVEEARPKEGSREERIRRALEVLNRRIRYSGLELGEQSIVPYWPEEVLRRGYGDCKDQSTILVAMLREAGVQAELALLRPGPGQDVSPEMPDLGVFSHAIVFLPEDGRYIDPTSPLTPFGALPASVYNRQALIVRPDTKALQRIPATRSVETRYEEIRRIELVPGAPARVKETTRATGWIADGLRSRYIESPEAEIRSGLDRYMQSMYGASAVDTLDLGRPQDLYAPLQLQITADDAETAWLWGDEVLVPIDPRALFEWVPETAYQSQPPAPGEDPLPRKSPLEMLPHQAEVRYEVKIPPGYGPRELPEAKSWSWGDASLSRSFSFEGDELRARFDWDAGDGLFSAEEIDRMRAELGMDAWYEPGILVEDKQVAAFHRGEVEAAMRGYQALIEAHPKEPAYRLQYAQALLQAGFGEAARIEARIAAEIAPDSAYVAFRRGFVEMHDSWGRELKLPFDRQAARGAFLRALALDPGMLDAHYNLGLVALAGDAPDLGEAIEHLGQWQAQMGDAPADLRYLSALLRAGRPDEVLRLTDRPDTSGEHLAWRLTALALKHGHPRVLSEVSRLGLQGQARTAILERTGQLILRQRRYADASALLRAGAAGAKNPLATRQLADQVEKMRPHEEILAEKPGPLTPALGFLALALKNELEPEKVRPLFASSLQGEWTETQDIEALAQARGSMRDADLNPEVLVDMTWAMSAYQVEGDARTGYRLRSNLPDSRFGHAWYIIEEKGGFRIRGFSNTPGILAEEALDRLKRNDLEGARRWIGWAIEDARQVERPASRELARLQSPEADKERLRLLARALLALDSDREKSETGIKALEAALPDLPEVDREPLQAVLVTAWMQKGGWEPLLKLAEQLAAERPEAPGPVYIQTRALMALHRWSEARDSARRLSALGDTDTGEALGIEISRASGDLAGCIEAGRKLVSSGRADSGLLNNLAWDSLIASGASPEVIRWATDAVTRSERPDPAHLHTLATALGESGDAGAAREVLAIAIQQLPEGGDLGPHWEHVVGLIAERWGLEEIARSAYGRVEPSDSPTATWILTQRRLEGMKR